MFQSSMEGAVPSWKKRSQNPTDVDTIEVSPRDNYNQATLSPRKSGGGSEELSVSPSTSPPSPTSLGKRRSSVDDKKKKKKDTISHDGKRRGSVDDSKRSKLRDKIDLAKKKKKQKEKDKEKIEERADKREKEKEKKEEASSDTDEPVDEGEEPEIDWASMVSGEFHSIEKETDTHYDFGEALKRENVRKNRYGNALANADTRVVLENGEDSDYINANYIAGAKGTKYIAAQAPLTNTFSDFWLMIYEQKTRVIMMLTKLQEKDRTKADIYWPRKGPLSAARGPGKGNGEGDESRWKAYGSISVLLEKSTEVSEEITLRYFRLREGSDAATEHSVVQIHYTGWPDFGVPDNTKAFRQLLELMDKHSHEKVMEGVDASSNGPIVLHCSAGLGRTGTLIAAHIASEMLTTGEVTNKEEIDMKKIVKKLRAQRAGMVQTSAQYKFLYALLQDM